MLGVAAAVCSVASCQKETEETPVPQAVAASAALSEQLAAQEWHQTGLTVNTVGGDQPVSADLFSHVKPGMLDHSVSFQKGGSYSVLKGGDQAKPVIGRWQLNSTNDSVTLTLPDQVRRLAVTELTPTTLRLAFTDAEVNGKVSTYTSVYSH